MSSVSKKTQKNRQIWTMMDEEIQHPNRPHQTLKQFMEQNEIKNISECQTCHTELTLSPDDYLMCSNPNCGILHTRMTLADPEWRFYGGDDNNGGTDPARCGGPINPYLPETSSSCIVLYGKYDRSVNKLRKQNEWLSSNYKEKTLYHDFQIITMHCQNAGLTHMLIDEAHRFYKQIMDSKQTFRGDNRLGILAATVYIACRKHNYPRTVKEVADMFHLDATNMTNGFKIAMEIIEQSETGDNVDEIDKTNLGKITADVFIDRFCSYLRIAPEMVKLCQFIAKRVESLCIITDNTPHSMAAGIIYFVVSTFNLNASKADVRQVANVSEVTINKCCKKLEMERDKLIPQVLLNRLAATQQTICA